jgi:diacylglycerol kinase family enzyme
MKAVAGPVPTTKTLGVGGIQAFDGARPDDGRLKNGVVTAKNPAQLAHVLTLISLSKAERSKYVHVASGQAFTRVFDRRFPYELDGSDRRPVNRSTSEMRPTAITVCVPRG